MWLVYHSLIVSDFTYNHIYAILIMVDRTKSSCMILFIFHTTCNQWMLFSITFWLFMWLIKCQNKERNCSLLYALFKNFILICWLWRGSIHSQGLHLYFTHLFMDMQTHQSILHHDPDKETEELSCRWE